MKNKSTLSDTLNAAILEMAGDAHAGGVMDQVTYEKITMRQAGKMEAATVAPLTADDIRALREQSHMSQAVFAKYLNLTPSYIAQLERGAKRPTGAVLALLNVIRRSGMAIVM